MRVAIYIVINRPIWIHPEDFGFDFKVGRSDVRLTDETRPTGNPAYSCKRGVDAGGILQG